MTKSSDLTIGELAERSGVAASALRFYEAKGLISAHRTSGNQRRYDRAMLRRVALVQAGKRAGIPLGTIHEALARLPHDRTPTKRDWERLSRAWHRDVEERIKGLELLRERLTSCIGCGCLSLQACGLFNPDDGAAAAGAGARYLLGDRLPTRGG